jgi:UDPglucose 6-dehydrogenase
LKILIIGSGVVGQATGIGFLQKKHEVIFYDIDKKVLQDLESRGYKAINEISKFGSKDLVFSMICVPTFTINGKMNLRNLENAIRNIGKFLQKMKQYHVVVVRSTVLPSTTRTQVIPLLEKYSGKKVGKDFGVCMNPEFLKQATALDDFLHPWRIVIGEYDKRSGDLLEALYAGFSAPIFRTDLDTAEMTKYIANTYLATKISFFNEIYLLCEKLGLDAHFMAKVVALDPRIGYYGIFGGRPFGGHCLPKDLDALISFMKDKKNRSSIAEGCSIC